MCAPCAIMTIDGTAKREPNGSELNCSGPKEREPSYLHGALRRPCTIFFIVPHAQVEHRRRSRFASFVSLVTHAASSFRRRRGESVRVARTRRPDVDHS